MRHNSQIDTLNCVLWSILSHLMKGFTGLRNEPKGNNRGEIKKGQIVARNNEYSFFNYPTDAQMKYSKFHSLKESCEKLFSKFPDGELQLLFEENLAHCFFEANDWKITFNKLVQE